MKQSDRWHPLPDGAEKWFVVDEDACLSAGGHFNNDYFCRVDLYLDDEDGRSIERLQVETSQQTCGKSAKSWCESMAVQLITVHRLAK